MLKLCRVTKVKVVLLVLVYVFNFNLFEFSAAILEKGLLPATIWENEPVLALFPQSLAGRNKDWTQENGRN